VKNIGQKEEGGYPLGKGATQKKKDEREEIGL